MKEETEGIAYDSGSSSVIKLNNGMVLYLREVNKYAERAGVPDGALFVGERNDALLFENGKLVL
jgi:hypothetical protein